MSAKPNAKKELAAKVATLETEYAAAKARREAAEILEKVAAIELRDARKLLRAEELRAKPLGVGERSVLIEGKDGGIIWVPRDSLGRGVKAQRRALDSLIERGLVAIDWSARKAVLTEAGKAAAKELAK